MTAKANYRKRFISLNKYAYSIKPNEIRKFPLACFRDESMDWCFRQIINPSLQCGQWIGVAFADIAIWNPSFIQRVKALLGNFDPRRIPETLNRQNQYESQSIFGYGTFELKGIQLLIEEGLISLYRGEKHDFLIPTPKLIEAIKQSRNRSFIHN